VTPDQAVVEVIGALEATHIQYMIVGSLATNFHGIPRSTADADFVLALEPHALQRLGESLPRELRLQAQGSFETVTGTLRYLIELDANPFVCELFALSDDPHDLERFSRRERIDILGRPASMASAEDMIVTKLRWAQQGNRRKDVDDVRNIIAVRDHELDWPHIRRWCAEHGTLDVLEQIRASIPTDR
jgi:hypothetical protein